MQVVDEAGSRGQGHMVGEWVVNKPLISWGDLAEEKEFLEVIACVLIFSHDRSQ